MDYDEFGYLNQQLAAMLREGVPLEGALRQLCQSLHRGRLRTEIQALEADLADGTPLREALARRKLPELYVRMVRAGLEGNDLPGMLNLLADYYQQTHSTWTRLKGLMVYPFILLLGSLALSVWLALVVSALANAGPVFESSKGQFMFLGDLFRLWAGPSPTSQAIYENVRMQTWLSLWLPPALMTALMALMTVALASRPCRQWLQWRLPVFKEASLAQFASALRLMVKSGGDLNDAIGVLRHLEKGTPLGRELARWQQRCAEGRGRFADIAAGSRILPPLFRWLVSSAGEDLATGLGRAAEVYRGRAAYRRELAISATLPVSLLLLGFMIMGQVYPFTSYIFSIFASFFSMSNLISR